MGFSVVDQLDEVISKINFSVAIPGVECTIRIYDLQIVEDDICFRWISREGRQ